MFNKTKSPAPQPQSRSDSGSSIPPLPDLPAPGAASPSPAAAPRAPAPAVAQRGLSTLSSDLQFEGNVGGAGDLQIDGQVKGDVKVGRLIVGETGAVEGNVSADYVEVRGRIVGGVSGKQVKLIATAYEGGDITAEQLSIGAFFRARAAQRRREAAAPAAPAPAPPPVEAAPQIIDMKPPAA